MTTYTIIHGTEIETGLSLEEAAQTLLQHDGADYEIRRAADGTGFELWHRKQVANKPWTKTVIYSTSDDEAAAEAEIFEEVIMCGHWDTDNLQSMTDETYRVMRADMEDE